MQLTILCEIYFLNSIILIVTWIFFTLIVLQISAAQYTGILTKLQY